MHSRNKSGSHAPSGPRIDYWAVSKPGKHFRRSSEQASHYMVKPSQPEGDLALSFEEPDFKERLKPKQLADIFLAPSDLKKSAESTSCSTQPWESPPKKEKDESENSLDLSEIISQKDSVRDDSLILYLNM